MRAKNFGVKTRLIEEALRDHPMTFTSVLVDDLNRKHKASGITFRAGDVSTVRCRLKEKIKREEQAAKLASVSPGEAAFPGLAEINVPFTSMVPSVSICTAKGITVKDFLYLADVTARVGGVNQLIEIIQAASSIGRLP